MKRLTRPDHPEMAETLRRDVFEGAGETDRSLRAAVGTRAAGGPPVAPPYDVLARQIGEAAYRTTDAQVADVLAASGSEKAAFEVILAAAVGAGLSRWQRAMKALEEATDAPA